MSASREPRSRATKETTIQDLAAARHRRRSARSPIHRWQSASVRTFFVHTTTACPTGGRGSHDRVHTRRATSDRSGEPSPVKPYTVAGRPNERHPPPRHQSASARRQEAGPTVTGSASSSASRRRAAAACSARSKTRSRSVASSTALPTRHRKTRGPHAAMLAQPRTFHPIMVIPPSIRRCLIYRLKSRAAWVCASNGGGASKSGRTGFAGSRSAAFRRRSRPRNGIGVPSFIGPDASGAKGLLIKFVLKGPRVHLLARAPRAFVEHGQTAASPRHLSFES